MHDNMVPWALRALGTKIKQAFALYESNELDELAKCCRKEVKKTKVRLIENHH